VTTALSTDGYDAVMRLARDRPDWLPAVRAALAEAHRCQGSDFAGAWVLKEVQRQHAGRAWYSNFRLLVSFGILEKTHGTPDKQRAYYRMVDQKGVRRALEELDRRAAAEPQRQTRLSFTAIGHSGRSDLSERAADILAREFPTG
jgi:hypothetical protein